MDAGDILRIETALGVSLPGEYREFLISPRTMEDPDDTSVFGEADLIIEATLDYRTGFEGMEPWPARMICIGDEADACPYALDCVDSRVSKIDKGNFGRPPLEEYPDFGRFIDDIRDSGSGIVGKESFADKLRFYLPSIVGLFLFFVVMPLLAMAIREIYRAMF